MATLPPVDRRRELAEIDRIYNAALVALAAKAIADSLTLWRDVSTSPQQSAGTVSQYLDRIDRVLAVSQAQTREIGIAYYRLSRALWTGFTIQNPSVDHNATSEGMDSLRNAFYHEVQTLAPQAMPGRPSPSQGPGDESIPIEQIKELKQTLADLDQRLANIQSSLNNIAGKYHRDVGTVDPTQPASEADQQRADIHKTQGTKAAATAEKVTLDSARSAVHDIARNDHRVIGYVRVSETGTPCGWCAMLIARGLADFSGRSLLYKSVKSAETDHDDGDEYHLHCHCRAVPVYSEEQYNSDPQFKLNRKYSTLWPTVTKGLSGKAAVSAWRKFFRDNPSQVY